MKKRMLSARERRESRFLARAPLFALPLLTLFFWAFGGGKGLASSGKDLAKGFAMRLPGPHVAPVTKLDKMGYYELAKKDSVAALEKKKIEDNYARRLGLDDGKGDAVVRRVQEKLGELKLVMAGRKAGAVGIDVRRRAGAGGFDGGRRTVAGDGGMDASRGAEPELGKLERMMNILQRNESGNEEIAQLSAVVEKLISVARPKEDSGLVRTAGSVVKPVVMTVKALPDEEDTVAGFDSSSIAAIVPEEQVVVGNGELRMELIKDLLVGGRLVPAGTELYGLATVSGDRLRVVVNGITVHERVLPVSLVVMDQDGLPGIYVPGAPVGEAVRESAGSDVGAVGPTVLTANLAGQAANAGINLARAVIGKKLRPVKVPAGYEVLLHVQNRGL